MVEFSTGEVAAFVSLNFPKIERLRSRRSCIGHFSTFLILRHVSLSLSHPFLSYISNHLDPDQSASLPVVACFFWQVSGMLVEDSTGV